LASRAPLGEDSALFLCVIPDPQAKFPRAREGEVGLEEAYALATHVHALIKSDKDSPRSPIIAIVDVKSQAYGRREETAAIYLAAAVASDAYASARMTGHPIITLVVGQALSGAFLTHGYQANRILAFDDPGVVIHAMHKEAAARVTRRSVAELDTLAKTILPLSYDIKDFAKLGLLHELLALKDAEQTLPEDVALVKSKLALAVEDARQGPKDLSCRWLSPAAQASRAATIATRKAMIEQWDKEA